MCRNLKRFNSAAGGGHRALSLLQVTALDHSRGMTRILPALNALLSSAQIIHMKSSDELLWTLSSHNTHRSRGKARHGMA